MSINYVWEKFYVAVQALAGGQGNIKERLLDAYISALIRLKPDDLPKEMQQEFSMLQEELTKAEPIGNEGKLRATINSISSDRAAEIAEKIVGMYDKIAKRNPLKDYH